MKKFLAAAMLMTTAAVASAQAPIGLFFSAATDGNGPTGNANNTWHYARNAAAPNNVRTGLTGVSAAGVPVLAADLAVQRLYIWATITDATDLEGNPIDTKVQGLNLNIEVDGDATIVGWRYYGMRRNHTNTIAAPFSTASFYRWEGASVNGGQGVIAGDLKSVNNTVLTAIQTNGLVNYGNVAYNPSGNTAILDSMATYDGDNGLTTMLLGYVDLVSTGEADIWIELGSNGIGTGAGTQAPVSIGGDPAILGGVGANGRRSANPDAVIVPEPASLLLLGLAALAIRRR